MARIADYKRPKNLKKTIVRLMAYFGGKNTWLLILVGFLVLLPALATLLGTYAIKYVVAFAEDGGNTDGLKNICIVTGAMFAIGTLASLLYSQIMARLAQNVVYRIRKDMFTHVQDLPISFFDTHSFGNIMSVFTNDVETVSEALNSAFASLIQYFCEIVGTAVCLFILEWRLSLIVFVFYIIMFIYIIFAGKKSKHYYNIQQKTLGELNGFAEEMIRGEKTLKVFNHQEAAISTFKSKNDVLIEASYSALMFSNSMVPMVMALSYTNYAIVTILGGLMVYKGLIAVGTIAAYLVFVRQIAMPINRFTGQANVLLNALAGAERIFSLLDEKAEENSGKVKAKLIEGEKQGNSWYWVNEDGSKKIPLKGDVRFEDVGFSYIPGHPVLNEVSLYAKPGQKIAFVGSTGAGKTTITNLINRFYDIQEGKITFDGIDIRDIDKVSLRSALANVLQDTHLFSGTIADNIRFGKLDATDEEIEKACVLANADSFIRRLPEGYKTRLTSDGSNLSSGQRQLLAIARAAVNNPPVLILDEATSSVDTHTEHLIQDGMDKLMEGRTVFVIAHRLSTVKNSNAIMVLEHGRIIERGSHEDLMKAKGRYYSLYTGLEELA